MPTLVLIFRKMKRNDKPNHDTFYSHSKAETIINESDINNDVSKSIYKTIISNIQNLLRKGPGWITDSVTDHNINISKYNP